MTASFLLWSPWEQQRVFPSKLGGAAHHIKQRCHESLSSTTGSLTIAERSAYAAACRKFNGLVSYLTQLAVVFLAVCLYFWSKQSTCLHVAHSSDFCTFRGPIRLLCSSELRFPPENSPGNRTIIHTEAAQLENISSTRDGYMLAGVMSSLTEAQTQLKPGQKGKRGEGRIQNR